MRKIAFVVLFLLSCSVVYAQGSVEVTKKTEPTSSFDISEYRLLAPLPGFEKVVDGDVGTGGAGDFTLASYIRTLVRVAIGVIGILAVVMIVISGVQYMGSDVFTEKEAAKGRLTGAIFGLILAVSSVLILRTINPDLTSLSIGALSESKWCEENMQALLGLRARVAAERADPKKKANLTADEKAMYDRAQSVCAIGVANNIDVPEALKTEYEREDIEITGSKSTITCKGGMVNIDTVNQKGIAVCADIAEKYKNMIAAAKKDGVTLTAYGGRTMEKQIALRKQNCGGNSKYNVYEKPSGECKPPTARPGRSMHQSGLAFDIGVSGTTICFTKNASVSNTNKCRTNKNPGFLWLEKNAKTYGFYNLPTEAWHWSVNGK